MLSFKKRVCLLKASNPGSGPGGGGGRGSVGVVCGKKPCGTNSVPNYGTGMTNSYMQENCWDPGDKYQPKPYPKPSWGFAPFAAWSPPGTNSPGGGFFGGAGFISY